MNAAPRAIVTGSSSGIGAAVCRRLLTAGYVVHGLDRAEPTIVHAGFKPMCIELGQAAPALGTQAAITELLAPGPPQALVHAAGILRTGPLGELTARAEEAAAMWRLHVETATQLADALLPAMARAGHGRVVLIGSRVASGMPGRSQYAATKAALVALARSWAAEVVAQGVTVNVVSPAATDTPMLHDPARAGSAPRPPPIGRFIRPDEVAALVAYLLGPDAAAITGQDIAVCGGSSLTR
jgi:NAD(P)-dependent dehydrogenase (short-subunit alcohol dehydrogenase family)